MNRILQNTLAILNLREQRKTMLLALGDVVINVLDIVVLAKLLFLVSLYTFPGEVYATSGKPVELDSYRGLYQLLGLFIAKNIGAYFLQKAKFQFAYEVGARLSQNNLLQFLEGNYQDYVGKDSSVHIRKISQQPVEFCHYVLSGFQQLFSETIMVLLAITAIIYFDAQLFGLLCIVLLPPMALLFFYTRKKLDSVRKNIKTSSEQALQHLKEALAGYVESNVYATHDFFTKRYSQKQQSLNRYLASLQSVQVLPSRLMEIFAVLGLLTLIVFNDLIAGRSIIDNLTIGAFLAAAYKVIPSLVKVVNAGSHIRTYAFTAEDLAGKKTQEDKKQEGREEQLVRISVSNLSFSYADKKVLENFNFEIKQGEITGLSALSGRGKTTFINLLLGFLEPATGQILFNNTTTTASQRQSYWKNISYVKQQPFLLHDTVLTNITLSAEDYNEQQLQYALKASGLDILIQAWPAGLKTIVSENGKNISGGQRQRIVLARALHKNADLLILDEPFNELDEAATEDMLKHLQSLSQQEKMILLISHDKKSLSFCTRTISLDA